MMSTFPMQSHQPFAYPTAPGHSHWYPHSPASTASFASPSSNNKRKRAHDPDPDSSTSDDSGSSDDGGLYYNARGHTRARSPAPQRAVKRMRTGAASVGMENGFARMSLQNLEYAYNFPPLTATTTAAPPLKEVKMKSRSWYEPEPDRIVVLDLEADSDNETETDATSTSNSRSPTPSVPDTRYSVSGAYLSRLNNPLQQAYSSHPSSLLGGQTAQLVLYKQPSLHPNMSASADSEDNVQFIPYNPPEPELYASIEEVDEDEDVQMMDVDS